MEGPRASPGHPGRSGDVIVEDEVNRLKVGWLECVTGVPNAVPKLGLQAYSFIQGRKLCLLKYCDDGGSCSTTVNASVSSAWLNGGCSGQPATACAGPIGGAALKVGSGVTLANFSVTIEPATSVPAVVAVWMPKGARSFRATGLAVMMHQPAVSNAFRIEGAGFELTDSRAVQGGSCLTGRGDSSPFEPSVVYGDIGITFDPCLRPPLASVNAATLVPHRVFYSMLRSMVRAPDQCPSSGAVTVL